LQVIAETNAISTGELDESVDTHDEEKNDDDMGPASSFTFDCMYSVHLAVLRFIIDFTAAKLLPEWHIFSLHPKIMMALHDKGFFTPTPIQSTTLPVALTGRDVIGVAQTVRHLNWTTEIALKRLSSIGLRKDFSLWSSNFK